MHGAAERSAFIERAGRVLLHAIHRHLPGSQWLALRGPHTEGADRGHCAYRAGAENGARGLGGVGLARALDESPAHQISDPARGLSNSQAVAASCDPLALRRLDPFLPMRHEPFVTRKNVIERL